MSENNLGNDMAVQGVVSLFRSMASLPFLWSMFHRGTATLAPGDGFGHMHDAL